tara:strand:+ start:2875 stop:3327 length:453 start_codon:yes stop_codon:yes gene_type:complete
MIKTTLLAGALAVTLSGCSSMLPKTVDYSAEPVERPLLVLPESEIANMKEVDYLVVTEENIDAVWKELEAAGKPIVLFALTHEGYEALALNNAEVIRYLSEQKAILIAYKEYYEKADKAIEDANVISEADKALDSKPSSLSKIKSFLKSD